MFWKMMTTRKRECNYHLFWVIIALCVAQIWAIDFCDPYFCHYWPRGTGRVEQVSDSIRKKCVENLTSAYVFGSVQIGDSAKLWVLSGTAMEYSDSDPPVGHEVPSSGLLLITKKSGCKSIDLDFAMSLPKQLQPDWKAILKDSSIVRGLADDAQRRLEQYLGGRDSLADVCRNEEMHDSPVLTQRIIERICRGDVGKIRDKKKNKELP